MGGSSKRKKLVTDFEFENSRIREASHQLLPQCIPVHIYSSAELERIMGVCGSLLDDEDEVGFMKVGVIGLPGSGKSALAHRLAWQATPKWILQNQKATQGHALYPWRGEPYPEVPKNTNLLFHELAGSSLMSRKARDAVCEECDLFLWCIDGTSSMCKSPTSLPVSLVPERREPWNDPSSVAVLCTRS